MRLLHKFLILLICFHFGLSGMTQSHLKKDGTPDRRYKENRSSTYRSSSNTHTTRTRSYIHHNGNYVYSVDRDKNGRIKRSESAKRVFMKQTGYPKGRKGYVVDHIKPLKRGGCDCPSNMQWQTKEEAKRKDKTEEP